MTHEFRTPVNAIIGLCNLLIEDREQDGRPPEPELDFIRKAADQLSDLVNDLLDLAKVEAGKTVVRPAPFKVESLFGALRGMERLESFLSVEQRVRWCGVGVVDINSFKWYNDTLGHAIGDKIIERVARILSDQIRSEDFLALERGSADARDLHARFGGDEFCFLIPDLPGCAEAVEIADRFKHAVEGHDWSRDDRRLAARPVRVDVGVVCLHLGPVAERRGVARKLAAELIHRADQLMYDAKSSKADHVYPTAVGVQNSALVEIRGEFVKVTRTIERRP